jgi:hypothetical protein
MKILCQYSSGGSSYVRSGWGRALTYAGHDFRFWVPERKSAFDAFNEFNPDVAILTTYDLDRALCKCVAARPEMKVVCFASAWGPLADNLDPVEFPIVRVGEQEKKTLARLKEETSRPDYVFIHTADSGVEDVLGGWRSIGIRPIGLLNAADLFAFYRGKPRDEFRCDWTFVGGRWPFKSRNIDRYLLPLCHPSTGLRGKVFGNTDWPVAQYLGNIDDQDVADLFASATVCPNVSEPHSTSPLYGRDIVERPFKILSSGGFCVSDHVPEAREVFSGEELPMASSPEEFREMIQHFVRHPEERSSYMERGHQKVVSQHTYFERAAKMLRELGLEDDAVGVERAKAAFLREVN